MRSMRLLVALCIALFAAAAAHAETAGQVLFAYGDTLALRGGRIVHLMAGAPIESGDQIHTGAESYLQVRFTDYGVMSLRPHTDFTVEDYAYEAHEGGRERAFFVLLRGGLRSLTGLIGHRDRSHYRLRTRTAYIGIRGTHYSVLMCEQNCTNEDGSLGEDGLYGGVIEGRIAVGPYGGFALEREFGAGEYFRLENETSIPSPLFTPPSFFWDKLEPQARSGGKTFAGIPWKPAPGAPSDPSGPVAGDPTGIAGSLLRTDGSLTLSPITAPLLNPVSVSVGSVVNPILAPVASSVGSTVGLLVDPVVAALASAVGSTVGSIANPILAPIAPVIGSTVGSVVNPVLAPVTPVIGSTVGTVVNPVLAPVAPVIGATATPVVAPVAPVIAPIAAVVPIAPVIAPPVSTVTLPTVPTLPVIGGLPSLLPKK
jgi:hypothetical protein